MKCKKVISMVLVATAILSTTAFATVGSRKAELFYKNIKIMLNGKEVVPTDSNGKTVEPFIIDGTTYLPVRGIASALGLNVAWDAETSTVKLDNVYNDTTVFGAFEKVLDEKGLSYEKVTMMAALVGAEQGIKYEMDGLSVEIYRFDSTTDAYLDAEKTQSLNLEGFGAFEAVVTNGYAMLSDDSNMIDIFLNIVK